MNSPPSVATSSSDYYPSDSQHNRACRLQASCRRSIAVCSIHEDHSSIPLFSRILYFITVNVVFGGVCCVGPGLADEHRWVDIHLNPVFVFGEGLHIFGGFFLQVQNLSEVLLGDCNLFMELFRVGSVLADVYGVLPAQKCPKLVVGLTCRYE